MTVSIACDELQDPAELEDLPVLSTRIIPNSTAGKAPSVAELVRLDVEAHVHKSADGTPKLWRPTYVESERILLMVLLFQVLLPIGDEIARAASSRLMACIPSLFPV